MAEYTIELRRIVEAGIAIFDFPYNFYDESKRAEFEKKFIQHFYFREIGCEAVERFKWYLRDKMETVFPYYNELFNAANIEYSVLNNYNLTEEFTTTRENQGKTSGVSSTRGQVFDNQNSESNQNRKVDSTGTANTTGNDTDNETTVNDSTVNATGASNNESIKKFLDTPSGKTDLTDSKYLTTLNHDTENSNTTNDTVSNSETTRNGKKTSAVNQTTEGNETTSDTVTATTSSEQRNTQDNNTRMYTDNKQTETHKLTRIGNIGVDTDSDMIEKHIRLQKTLRQIELLFFNECEDLFMLVY